MLYVHQETSYDKFNENYNRIYRLEGDNYGKLPAIMGTYVKDRLPEVENIAQLVGGRKAFISYLPDESPEDRKDIEVNFFWADSATFDVFTLPFVQGNPHNALKEPFTVVLTESSARKLFADSNPLTRSVEFVGHQFRVTGVITDVKSSHIEIDALFSQESIPKVYPLAHHGWNKGLWSATYLLMTDGIDKALTEKKINDVLMEINDGILFDIDFEYFQIRPLADIYFHGSLQNLQYGLQGNLKLIQVLSAVGVFVLVLACINYINLTTARSIVRAKEVAIKRVSGSSLSLLRYQFILESVIVSLIALVVAMTIVQIFLPTFNLMGMVDIGTSDLNRPVVWAGIVLGVVLLGSLAGVYPAIYLTAARPVGLMKGEGLKGSGRSMFRKVLMTGQFTISIVMISGIITNLRQMHFVRNVDLGFRKDQVVQIYTPNNFPEEFSLRETFKERLMQHHNIINVAFSIGNPGEGPALGTLEIEGIKRNIEFFFIDDAYLDLMEIKIAQGRAFSPDRPGERVHSEDWSSKGSPDVAALVNETMVAEFGIESPLGKIIHWTDREGRVWKIEIIGVVRDFHLRSLHHKIEPLFLFWTDPRSLASIRVNPYEIPASLKLIEKEWKNVYGQEPFRYKFLDETFDLQYKNDEQLATAIGYFTGLAVIIACLGLFALSSLMISRRTKEIGIRKSMGAPTGKIYSMLSWDFLKWILVSVVIASPVAWYLMHQWLETFAYHITLGIDIFLMAGVAAILIALLTVTWQSLRAANANPVKALRYE